MRSQFDVSLATEGKWSRETMSSNHSCDLCFLLSLWYWLTGRKTPSYLLSVCLSLSLSLCLCLSVCHCLCLCLSLSLSVSVCPSLSLSSLKQKMSYVTMSERLNGFSFMISSAYLRCFPSGRQTPWAVASFSMGADQGWRATVTSTSSFRHRELNQRKG